MAHGIILMVEDSDDDAALTRRAFQQCDILNPIRVVSTGEAALAYLHGSGAYQDRHAHPIPILVLLDLALPGLSGIEILKMLASSGTSPAFPVVVISGTDELKQVPICYKLGATSFLLKPVTGSELMNLVQHVPRLKLKPIHTREFELVCI